MIILQTVLLQEVFTNGMRSCNIAMYRLRRDFVHLNGIFPLRMNGIPFSIFISATALPGSPLKYTGYSGFNAYLDGARFKNVNWNFL